MNNTLNLLSVSFAIKSSNKSLKSLSPFSFLNLLSSSAKRYIKQLQNFVLWHYQCGSKYNTSFWEYAKSLSFKDDEFDSMLYESKSYDKHGIIPNGYGGHAGNDDFYGQWSPYSFKVWDQGMTKELTDKSSLV